MEKPSILRDLEKVERDPQEGKLLDKVRETLERSQEEARAEFLRSDMSVRVEDMSRNELIRQVKKLQDQLNKADLAGMVAQAVKARPQFGHREAFMLMKYVSEGGTDTKLIWNSRDGVTPFNVHIDGMKYTHRIHEMQGPYFDRPEGIVAQWETRTEIEMMLACRRMLNKGLLLGRLTEGQVMKYQNDPDFARSWNLHIGLRSMPTGRYTDDPGVAA